MSKHKMYTEDEIKRAIKMKIAYVDKEGTEELFEAEDNCTHVIKTSTGGGVECMRCGGWFCY